LDLDFPVTKIAGLSGSRPQILYPVQPQFEIKKISTYLMRRAVFLVISRSPLLARISWVRSNRTLFSGPSCWKRKEQVFKNKMDVCNANAVKNRLTIMLA